MSLCPGCKLKYPSRLINALEVIEAGCVRSTPPICPLCAGFLRGSKRPSDGNPFEAPIARSYWDEAFALHGREWRLQT